MYLPLKIVKIVPKMSFPPGPPLHIPGLPPVPPMLPPPFGMPHLGGMIPMTVGMMPAPMMAPVAMTMPAPMPMPQHPKMNMQKRNQNIHNTYKRENHMELQEANLRGPPVTVFVGNITDRAPDNLVRQILQRCGIVLNWKRVQGANGKLQAFGFCEYGEPEAALRAIRLLHDYELGDKKLVVKVDAKTKEKLDEYKAKVMAKQEEIKDGEKKEKEGEDTEEKDKECKKEDGEEKEEGEASDEPLDELTKQRDHIIKSTIDSLVRVHESDLSRPVEPDDSPPPAIMPNTFDRSHNQTPSVPESTPKPHIEYERRPRRNELDDMGLEEDRKSLIHREIDKFRDTYKRAEEEKDKDGKDRRSSRRHDYDSPEPRTRDRDRDRDRERDRDRGDREREKRYREREHSSQGDDNRRRRRSRERERGTRSPVPPRERERSRERPPEPPRSPSRDRDWIRERDREREQERESRNREREREREREANVERNRERDRLKDEEDDDSYERKKLEKKLREKEVIYQERLRNWETRERKRAKEYERERLKLEEQKKDEAKEARRLKEFLEDYDDERDDPKYFKGSGLLRRMKEREKEIEEDLLDRQHEKDELDELRKKLAEQGHPDPDAEVERYIMEESRLLEHHLIKEQTPDSDKEPEKLPPTPSKMKPIPQTPLSPPAPPPPLPPAVEVKIKEEIVNFQKQAPPIEDESTQNSFTGFSDLIIAQDEAKPLGFTSLRIGGSPTQTPAPAVVASPGPSQTPQVNNSTTLNFSGAKRKMTIDEVFNANDDEPEQKKKRKLIPLDDAQEPPPPKPTTDVTQLSVEEKRKHIKNLIEKIPTEKEELFKYTLDWSVVDKALMEKRIRPWINKKIIEYIGEEERTLVDFICSKVMVGSDAQSILDDVSMVLDEEAEVFVVKMWRLLIYEIEAKKVGLVSKTHLGSQDTASQGKS